MLNEHRKKAVIDLLLADATPQDLKSLSEDLDEWADKMCEEKNLHQFIDDHCGKKEHRFCSVCYTRQYPETPQNDHAGQGKANEPVGRNPTLPSASLGPRSIFGRFSTWVRSWDLG